MKPFESVRGLSQSSSWARLWALDGFADFPCYVRDVSLRLSTSNLESIERRGIPVPHYDRGALTPRILHIGVGGFHRAHLARYIDELAESGNGWGIRGIGLLDADRRIASVLESQDHLYTLIERDSNGSRPRIVGSIVDYRLVGDDVDAFAQQVAQPDIAILSMTITEGGYSLDKPNPTIDTIVTGLDVRRASGGKPLTILSCDNLPGNGNAARQALTRVSEARSGDLVRYVETACSFPNSMVDRITPQTTDADRAWLHEEFGVEDGWPVVSEPFRQWVLEDSFAAGRPSFEDVGALFTNRVHDWELYKLRMLNATHSCLAYLAAIAGIVYVDEALAVPAVSHYLERFLSTEAIPTLAEIPGHPARRSRSDRSVTLGHFSSSTRSSHPASARAAGSATLSPMRAPRSPSTVRWVRWSGSRRCRRRPRRSRR